MSWERVAIVGVGLMGGSLGLALKERGLAGQVVGVGRRKRSLTRALQRGACDEITTDIAAGVRKAEMVVVATPVGSVLSVIQAAAPVLSPDSVLTDVASAKSHIVRAAESLLGHEQLRFVGGHPLVGSEKKGVQHAHAELYEGATVVLTPVEGTDPAALDQVSQLWRSVGATSTLLSPEEHDTILAQTSHLPHLVAAALVNALARGWGRYSGPGFLDGTRVAASDPALWKDIFLSNATEVVRALARFRKQLENLENALAAEPEALERLLTRAQRLRQGLKPDSRAAQKSRSSKAKTSGSRSRRKRGT